MSSRLVQRLGVKLPVIQAPMYNAATPALVAAVAKHGALGSYGAGYTPPDVLRATLTDIVNVVPDKNFNVNLFVDAAPQKDSKEAWDAFEEILTPVRHQLGLDTTPRPFPTSPGKCVLEQQVQVLLDIRPRVVSFCFGVLDPKLIKSCQDFAIVLGTATTVEEAIALEAAGVDGIIAQGSESGGHRGTFLPVVNNADALIGSMSLIPQICDAVQVPVIAAGGIMDRRHMLAAFALGAEMVQVGTAFLTTPECALPPQRKQAIVAAKSSVASTVTRGLTGRHARMLRNPLVDALHPHEEEAASSLLQRQRMADIFKLHDPSYSAMLAGQSHRYCQLQDTVAAVLSRFE
ncbi:nitronate monooxygenase [Thraustotheca clavata]|uniref:Nitronate monooxygenase n=1 Tax=Thraustotheca clavata TaxID=74557 RepID=A0A1V9Y8F0_9STRA|nr:nitronate monooxygenase [Thraustotheca clavata]